MAGMLLDYLRLRGYPRVFLALTGLTGPEFAALLTDLVPAYQAALRRARRRLDGSGHRAPAGPLLSPPRTRSC